MTEKKIVKKGEPIAVRLSEPLASRFLHLVAALGVERSELAEMAIEAGLEKASKSLRIRKLREARETVRRLNARSLVRDTGFEPVTPTVSTWDPGQFSEDLSLSAACR